MKQTVHSGILTAFPSFATKGRDDESRQMLVDLISLLNTDGDLPHVLRLALSFLRDWSGCSSVGIRLKRGADYPFFETQGFTPDFVKSESRLCTTDADGHAATDGDGNPVLECMCGAVIDGRVDPSLPCFTARGSFWTNGTTELLAKAKESGLPSGLRKRCNRDGFESVALVPMHLGSRIIGLLQISDRRLGRFSPETIASMERLADSMATFVAHRQAQEDLRMQEEQFRCLVESSENHLFILDRAGRYIMSNGRVSQFGLTDGDRLVGRCLAQVHAPDVSLVYQRHLEQVFVSDAAVEFEHTLPTPEGERLHVDTLYPLHRDGKVWAVGGVCRDVTENRRAEKERQWHVQELARMERITTMNELASALVHELNQPLTGILSNAQAAQHLLNHDPPDVVELRDALQDIVADDKRAAEIIHRTRALIRRETSVRERINLNDLLESVARYVHSDMVINGTKILTCPGPGLPDVMGDRVQLEQVLMNLIRNGVQAMRASDAPDREIRIATGSGNGSVVKVSVRDRGPGISPSAINLIFEPLFTTREEGVGLGLAICRSIVQAHGGRIWAENNAEGGSTLSFELPA